MRADRRESRARSYSLSPKTRVVAHRGRAGNHDGMRLWVALALATACSLLAGCGAHGAPRPESTIPAAGVTAAQTGAAAPACTPLAQASSAWREMTWPEYYIDVETRAWRRGARVIWIDPPPVTKAPKVDPAATVCAR
jgi:hypothetical protein